MKFKLDMKADANMTSFSDDVFVAPLALVERFGEPIPGYDKVSGEYKFVGEEGEVYTVYDWKMTTLHDPYGIPPDQFWADDEPQEFHIGSHVKDVSEFKAWLVKELAYTQLPFSRKES